MSFASVLLFVINFKCLMVAILWNCKHRGTRHFGARETSNSMFSACLRICRSGRDHNFHCQSACTALWWLRLLEDLYFQNFKNSALLYLNRLNAMHALIHSGFSQHKAHTLSLCCLLSSSFSCTLKHSKALSRLFQPAVRPPGPFSLQHLLQHAG